MTPSGRRQRHRVLVSAVLLMVALGLFHAWSVFVVPLQEQLGASRGAVSGIYSLATATFTLSMLAGHRLHDRVHPAPLAAGIGLLAALGLALAGTGAAWAVWIGYGVLFGVANGVGYGFALQATALVLPDRSGLAASIAVTAYALGPALLAPALEWSVRAAGVLETFAIAGALTAAVAAAQLPLLAGLRLPAPAPGGDAPARARVARRTFWLLWLGFLLSAAAGLIALAHAAALVTAQGGSAQAAALGVSLTAVGNAAGRLLGGWLTELVPARVLLAGAGLASALALLAAAVAPPVGVALAALGVVGLGYGAASSIYPAATAALYGPAALARVYGRLFTAWGLAGLGAPVLAGALFDLSGAYHATLLVAAACSCAGGLVALLLPVTAAR
jgi:MFS family permease